tara:strand:+ start:189 stop:770 length:582 start_codon:yes stop_codon:yes gene_type:complete
MCNEKSPEPNRIFEIMQNGLMHDIEDIWNQLHPIDHDIPNDFFGDEKVQRIIQSEFHEYVSRKEIHFRDFIEIIFETPSTLIPFMGVGGTDEDIHTILSYFRRCGYFFDMGEQGMRDLECFAMAYNYYWENFKKESNPSIGTFKEIYEEWVGGGDIKTASFAVSILSGSFEYNILHSKADSYKHFEEKMGYRF